MRKATKQINTKIDYINTTFGYKAVDTYTGKGHGSVSLKLKDRKFNTIGLLHAKNAPAIHATLAGIEAAQLVYIKEQLCQKAQKNSWATSLKKLFS
jgi:hypothetical protein